MDVVSEAIFLNAWEWSRQANYGFWASLFHWVVFYSQACMHDGAFFLFTEFDGYLSERF